MTSITKNTVDLNVAIGEGFEGENSAHDEKLIKRATRVNIACGFHGGDPAVMQRSVDFAIRYDVAIGAYVGLPSLMGMGVSPRNISAKKTRAQVLYQLGALHAFAVAAGTQVRHLKLQGALYTAAHTDKNLAQAVVDAVAHFDSDIAILGPAGSELLAVTDKQGLNTIAEVYADRAYNKDGSLVARSDDFSDSFDDSASAEIADVEECVQRSIRVLKTGKLTAVTGEEIDMNIDSISVDSDNPYAVQLLDELRRALHKEGCALHKNNISLGSRGPCSP